MRLRQYPTFQQVTPFGKINLDEGGAERTVTLESTIPLLCTNLIFASECKLQVKLAALTNPAGTFFDFFIDKLFTSNHEWKLHM